MDYTESGDKSRCQNLMWTVAPQIKTIEQPVQFLDRQHDGFVGVIGRCFEAFGFKAFEPKAKAVAFPVQNLHAVSGLVEKNEKHRVKHGDLDVQFDQRGQAINGFSEVHGFGVEIDFFDFGIGTHHGRWLLKEIGSTASGIK
ncbi:hypothetical protein [Pseudomonas mandelii]|uniref:hypothetical protein n=1 Tax=Pseudomonas mandelii TaxID=75612 RepID=UPI003F5A2588